MCKSTQRPIHAEGLEASQNQAFESTACPFSILQNLASFQVASDVLTRLPFLVGIVETSQLRLEDGNTVRSALSSRASARSLSSRCCWHCCKLGTAPTHS